MKDLQKDFFYKVSKKISSENKAIALYQDLIFHRFYEVLSNAYPIFSQNISDEKFKEMVQEFLEFGAKNEYIWKMPKEFKKFLCSNKKYKNIKYLKDLLWFEWIEIELFMQNYKNLKKSRFSWRDKYILNKNARMKKMDYKIHFQNLDKKEKCAILAYYDVKIQAVMYREISLFMYDFLKLARKKSLKKSTTIACKKNNLDENKSKKILKKALKELISLGVLIKK